MSSGEPAGRGASARDPIRVLLVEDEPANRALVRAIVRRATARGMGDFSLVEAETLAEAREQVASSPFSVILLDVRVPDGSGLDLLSEVRALGPTRPWVIVLSASVRPDEQLRAMGAGSDLFLPKPVDARKLIDALGRAAHEGPPTVGQQED